MQPLLIRAKDITEQGTVRVPADVEKAAVELDQLFQRIAEALPKATVHVFYYGPLGILVRACRRLGLRRTPIVVWDAYYPGAIRLPAIEFRNGGERLLITSGPVQPSAPAPSAPAAPATLTRASLRRLLGAVLRS